MMLLHASVSPQFNSPVKDSAAARCVEIEVFGY
jgi:hypothetical protein